VSNAVGGYRLLRVFGAGCLVAAEMPHGARRWSPTAFITMMMVAPDCPVQLCPVQPLYTGQNGAVRETAEQAANVIGFIFFAVMHRFQKQQKNPLLAPTGNRRSLAALENLEPA
jgi:hypothetical protein